MDNQKIRGVTAIGIGSNILIFYQNRTDLGVFMFRKLCFLAKVT